jgi:nucleoid DNA-binding protein
MSLVKADMSESISIQRGLPHSKSAQLVASLLKVKKRGLENGQEVLITGCGKW